MGLFQSLVSGVAPDILFGVALPVLFGAFGWGGAFPFWNSARTHLILLPIAAVVPLLLAVSGLRGVPSFPPLDGDGWIFWLGAVALFVAFYGVTCTGMRGSNRSGSEGARIGSPSIIVLSMFLAAIAVFPLYRSEAFSVREAELHFVFIAAAAAVLMALLKRGAVFGGRAGVWLFFLYAIANAVLLIFSSSAYLGLLVGSLAAALGPAVVLGFVRKNIFVPEAVGLALALLFSTSIAQGYLYAYMPLECALLMIAAPGFLALASDGKASLTRVLGAAAFLSLALLLGAARYFA